MINIKYNGRLGNKMFQYAIARIISKKLNYSLKSNLPPFPNAKKIGGKTINKPLITLKGHKINLKQLTPTNRFYLDGYFQNFEYYKNYKDIIKKWFMIEGSDFKSPNDDDLVLHVRGGDLYLHNKKIKSKCHPHHIPLPLSHYINIIKTSTFKGLKIVTEDPQDIVVKEIKKIYPNAEIISQSVIEDYYYLTQAQNLVISASTLSWWAAWMSTAPIIHFPLYGCWHPESVRSDVNLIVDEDRYKYYDLGVFDNWSSSPEQIKKILKL